jgi:O-methyltransferase involved in polyketide biosynthesis
VKGPFVTPTDDRPLGDLDTGVPHIARVYDCLLGGKDNFAADREAAAEFAAIMPSIVVGVRSSRAFLGRAVWHLAAEAGIRQFLDIGTGLPTTGNTHQIAQDAAPDCRIVYVDNDPMVLSHAKALLTSTSEGRTDYIDADLRDTDMVLARAAETLDFSEPVAVMLIGVLHCIPDEDDPLGIVRRIIGHVTPGSYLILGHPASDVEVEASARATARLNTKLTEPVTFRTREQITSLLDGLELEEPGIVQYPQWRPGPGVTTTAPIAAWCAVARKP